VRGFRTGWGNAAFQGFNYALFLIILLICVYPFFYIFLVSVSDPAAVAGKLITVYPIHFTLKNYGAILQLNGIYQAFFVSVVRTVVGTFITLFFTSMMAYTLTKRELAGRKIFYRVTVAAMYINAGLIPWYIMMRNYGLKDNFLLYVLPSAVSIFTLILIKTFIEQISTALEESAIVDGAGYFTIYYRIIVPVSKPVIAAVAVFSAVHQWNSWYDNFLLVSNSRLMTMQLILYEFLRQAESIASSVRAGGEPGEITITPYAIRMTVTMVVTWPVLLVYPLLQRHFVKGIMLGSVKG